jgi:hypothetical protein
MSEEKLDSFVRRNLQPPHISRARQERVLSGARPTTVEGNGRAGMRHAIARRFAVPLGSALVLGIALGLVVPAAPQSDALSILLSSSRTTVLGF